MLMIDPPPVRFMCSAAIRSRRRPLQIHGQGSAEDLIGIFARAGRKTDSGGVHQDVQPAPGLDRVAADHRKTIRVGNVTLPISAPAGTGRTGGGIANTDREGARFGKSVGNGGADSAGGAGHDRDFALQ